MSKKVRLLLTLLFFTTCSFGQFIVSMDSSLVKGLDFPLKWKFQRGDNAQWSQPSYDDSGWDSVATRLTSKNDQNKFGGLGWFRVKFRIDTSSAFVPLAIRIDQTGASEIWVDGKKCGSFGTISTISSKDEMTNSLGIPIPIDLNDGVDHLIAVRYSNHDFEVAQYETRDHGVGFSITMTQSFPLVYALYKTSPIIPVIGFILACFYLVLGIVHLLIWFFYKIKRSNLYYFLFTLTLAVFPTLVSLSVFDENLYHQHMYKAVMLAMVPLLFVNLLSLVYSLFYDKFPKRYKWYLIIGILTVILFFSAFSYAFHILIQFVIVCIVDALITILIAIRNRKKGSWIIASGFLFFTGFFLLMISAMIIISTIHGSINLGTSNAGMILIALFFLAVISIPVSMSVFLAKDIAGTNRALSQKLIEIESLSAQTVEQEKEKQKILESQKEMLEMQVTERTAEITHQKEIIEEKNKDITDSIQYAQRIQQALLPTERYIQKNMDRLNNNLN